MNEQEMKLQLALSALSREWDFLNRVQILEPKRLLPAIDAVVNAYRASLKASAALESLPYVIPEIGQ